MRHLIGVILAIVMATVLFFAGAWGYLRLTALTAPLSRLPAGGGSLLSNHGTLAALHPVGRMGDVGDIAEAIAYLETAEFVTGEILHVDGGQSAGH